jgi:hypothetical protein
MLLFGADFDDLFYEADGITIARESENFNKKVFSSKLVILFIIL